MSFPKILQGVQVIDFSRLLPGPFASELLIKLGAKVHCILSPSSDPLLGNYSPFIKLKEGKTFQTLDLKQEKDLLEAKDLISKADILLEGFRPGTLEKLGLGFESVKQLRTDILYVSLSGYTEDHPKHLLGAHDLNFLVDSGLYSLLFPDHGHEIPMIQLADLIGGFYGAFQILIEWIHRVKEKGPRHLKISIVEGLELMWEYLQDPSTQGIADFLTGGLARYRIYKTADDRSIVVAALEPKFYRTILDTLKVKVFEGEDENQIIAKIQAEFSKMTLEECRSLFKDLDACVSFIPTREEVLKS